MLHGVGRRGAPRRLRHARPPRRRASGHHPRGSAGGAARALGRGVRPSRGQPVRLLHARHRAPAGRARRGGVGEAALAPRHRGGPARPPVPVHRLAVHRRRRLQRAGRRRRPAAIRRRSSEPGAGRVARPGRRAGLSELGPGRGPRRRRLRRRLGATRRARPVGRRWTARPRPPRRPGRERPRAGQEQHGAAGRTPSRCRDGDWALTLQTSWLEPAYVEPDASWSRPGGTPASPLANGGAFGGKRHSPAPADARALADASGAAVRVLWRREDVVRRGPKRPPLAVALRPDGTGLVRVGRTERSADLEPLVARVRACCPGVEVEMVDVAGPPVSSDLRGAGWAEVLAARAVLEARAARSRCGPRCGARRRARCGQRPRRTPGR